ncbi:MAG: ABC transporter permease, partial [Spirochaetes bacterium]
MRKYIIKRLLLGFIVLMGVVFVTFFLTRVIPSDPAAKWVGPRATAVQIEAATIELGLDKPLFFQFFNYVSHLAKGDLGRSLRSHQPISQELLEFIPATAELVFIATLLAIIIGIPMGIYSAKYKNKGIDHVSRLFSVGAVSLPTFWVALFLQLIFYNWMEILPLGSRLSTQISILYDVPDITGLIIFDSLITGNW